MTDTMATPDLLLERLAKNVAKAPKKTLLSFISPGLNGGKIQKSFTYEELEQETSDLAQRLLESGLAKGDR
jgi:acyl-CoA synthetase (AMP-forming)/AMP-acid ligase II